MPGYNATHWAATEERIGSFIKKLDKVPIAERPTELMAEIAVQLMWLNAHVEEVHTALHRIAEKG